MTGPGCRLELLLGLESHVLRIPMVKSSVSTVSGMWPREDTGPGWCHQLKTACGGRVQYDGCPDLKEKSGQTHTWTEGHGNRTSEVREACPPAQDATGCRPPTRNQGRGLEQSLFPSPQKNTPTLDFQAPELREDRLLELKPHQLMVHSCPLSMVLLSMGSDPHISCGLNTPETGFLSYE